MIGEQYTLYTVENGRPVMDGFCDVAHVKNGTILALEDRGLYTLSVKGITILETDDVCKYHRAKNELFKLQEGL